MPIGGFNKEDVLEYISAQQQQVSELQQKIAEKERLIKDAERRESALKVQLEDCNKKADEYFELSQNYSDTIETQRKKIESLEKTIRNIEIGFERTKDVEGQIGALVIDALLYSDKIIHSAKSSALQISSGAKATIEKAVSGVDEIGSDISEISDNFGEVVTSLVKKLNLLSENLTGVADSLDKSGEDVAEKGYVMGESSDVSMPNLSEKDFSIDADNDEDISDEEIQELLERLNIKFTPDTQAVSDYAGCTQEIETNDASILASQDIDEIDDVPVEIPVETDFTKEELFGTDAEDFKEPESDRTADENSQESEQDTLSDIEIDNLIKDIVPMSKEKSNDRDYSDKVNSNSQSDILSEDISELLKRFLDSNE